MTLQTFETKDAKYYLGLGDHTKSSAPIFEEVDFSSLDFMVFESGPFTSAEGFHKILGYDRQYSQIYERILKESKNISLYGLDRADLSNIESAVEDVFESGLAISLAIVGLNKATKKTATRRDILKGAGILFGGLCLTGIPIAVNLPKAPEINSIRTNLLPSPVLGLRDALAAKKIANYLIPKHKQEGRKLQVAIIYGAMHSGIELRLQHPSLNDATLAIYHDLLGYCSNETLNRVLEIRKEEEKISTSNYSCDLF